MTRPRWDREPARAEPRPTEEMMETLELRGGDLVAGPGGFKTVRGSQKVRQDLSVALREPIECDRFHPRWGSLLPDYIGQPINEQMQARIRSETNRIIQNYAFIQAEAIKADQLARRKPRYSTDEIVAGINSIDVRQSLDRFYVRISLRLLSNDEVVLVNTVKA